MKLRSFHAANKMINKVKKQPSELEKIFAHYTANRGVFCLVVLLIDESGVLKVEC